MPIFAKVIKFQDLKFKDFKIMLFINGTYPLKNKNETIETKNHEKPLLKTGKVAKNPRICSKKE